MGTILARSSVMASTTEEVPDEGLRARPRHAPAAELAWVILMLDGVLLGLTSLFWIVHGRFFDVRFYDTSTRGVWPDAAAIAPSIERVAAAGVRTAGFLGAMASIFVVTVTCTGFRRGEPWAWYALLVLPAYAVLDFALVAGYGAVTFTTLVWDAALFGLAAAGLTLSYGTFFRGASGRARPSHA